ncbi:DUF262 domain-containing protein [Candidatus Saccharibacteria bacterium]|nr:DUF262 domain-containing protein [Candidatus Saccharibacteria bacterium]
MYNKTDFMQMFEDGRCVIIPSFQRDYAQGRTDEHACKVRAEFLESLYQAITNKSIVLDFIYGDIDQLGRITLLDGQQRMTTLFLLYWYAAKRDKIPPVEYDFLTRFSYETRSSSRQFCELLVTYNPDFSSNAKLSERIKDQYWFPLGWVKDPTISAMLEMLDAIDDKFQAVDNIWSRLKAGRISFYHLYQSVGDAGFTNDLYIKMNSRGKPLTDFENFKAELEGELEKVDPAMSREIARRIDNAWTDLLWPYYGPNHTVDDAFLRCFYYVCQVICFRDGGTLKGEDKSYSSLIKYFFSLDSPKHKGKAEFGSTTRAEKAAKVEAEVKSNIDYLKKFFDLWIGVAATESIGQFFNRFISTEHVDGKIKISGSNVDLFGELVRDAHDDSLSLPQLLLFYAFNIYVEHRSSVSESAFRRRIRIVNNLIQNSSDVIRDDTQSPTGNRMPIMLEQISNIILDGVVDHLSTPSFNGDQIDEEKDKLQLINAHPELMDALSALEDHDFLYGQIGIVGVDINLADLSSRFISLFRCDLDKVNCVLMTIGDYSRSFKDQVRFQLGCSKHCDESWRTLFHHNSYQDYKRTKAVLGKLLSLHQTFSDDLLDEMIRAFLDECEKYCNYDWRYYYVKYSEFRPDDYYGRYSGVGSYEMLVLPTKQKFTKSAYSPFLEAVRALSGRQDLLLDYYGNIRNILISDKCMYNFDRHNIYVYDLDPEQENGKYKPRQVVSIDQNLDSIDREDRIRKLASLITNPQPE